MEFFKKWFDIFGGLIKLVIYVLEYDILVDFENLCFELGVVLSIGYFNDVCEYLKISKVIYVIYLYNVCYCMMYCELGVLGYVLLECGINVELIVDGIYVYFDMVKLVY